MVSNDPEVWDYEKEKYVLTEDDQSMMDNLIKFIKMNKKLVHIDLTNCGLSGLMIEQFGPAFRRAKGLRAIHLSGNPALYDPKEKERLVDFLVKRAHGIKVDSYNIIDFR